MKFIKNIVLCVVMANGFIFSCGVEAAKNAASTLDIYSSKYLSQKNIEKKLDNEMQVIAEVLSSPLTMQLSVNQEKFDKAIKAMTSNINAMGKFSYVGISPTIYPGDKVIHVTIDVVDQDDKTRQFVFLPIPTQHIADPDHLIAAWQEYEKLGIALFYEHNQAAIEYKSCPAFHCVFGFEHPSLKKYERIFSEGANKNKQKLITILRNDSDEERRASAAYLLAHISDGNELIKILVPSIYDAKFAVRNSVMRVLAMTLNQVKVNDFPVKDIVRGLDFPIATDRNKALAVLLSLISANPGYTDYVVKNAGKQLIAELKLSQPNVHGLAYEILKKVSGKEYSEHDYRSWAKWLKAHQA
jgi:hypothetical protein